MKEVSEEFLQDYKKQESITFSRKSNYLMVLSVFLSLGYLLLGGKHYYIAVAILILAFAYGAYKELSKKCKSCGKRYEQANLRKVINAPGYSELHQSFKILEVQFCSSCKKYSENEHQPPSW